MYRQCLMHSQIALVELNAAKVRARQTVLFAHVILGGPALADVETDEFSSLSQG